MAKSLKDWVENDVREVIDRPLSWLSDFYFFRDPSRPVYSDSSFFFSPADGIILYQERVKPDECLLDIKGRMYSLRDAMRDETFDQECLVIGIFMTMYDVHVNRVPFAGTLCYKELEPIGTNNLPMIEIEKSLIDKLKIDNGKANYLHHNQRILNRIYSADLRQLYYVLQIADYDVGCITPFQLGQVNQFSQNERFSQIRYGSQVELIVPLSERFEFEFMQDTGVHVEAGLDPLIKINQVVDETEQYDDELNEENAASQPGQASK